jgi:3-phosphoshikimate 1-carboxyvinyltransferase
MIQTIRSAGPLHGTVPLPGDKSISHRYAMLAAIAEGVSEVHHFAASQDCHSTLRCLRSLGVDVRVQGDSVTIAGCGLRGLRPSQGMLDAGNSGTTLRLLSGILAGQPFETVISGDESLSRRPMERILQPLRAMGAHVTARERGLPPIRIRGGTLKAIRYDLPVASAQVKSCVLLAGLYGDGSTAVKETIPTRDHTELALRHFGASLSADGAWIEIQPGAKLEARNLEVPGDISGAAFFLVAAALVPGSELTFARAGLNGRRRELLDYLDRCGLDLAVEDEVSQAGEPRGTVRVRQRESRTPLPTISGELTAALIDEIPILAVLGSQAGGLKVADAGELRVKESDRIVAICKNLRAMGAEVEEKPDGFEVAGEQALRGTDIVSGGDHRIAMAFAVAGLTAEGETRIHEAECADVSFPGFWDVLSSVAGR